jgi:hypothetical protein
MADIPVMEPWQVVQCGGTTPSRRYRRYRRPDRPFRSPRYADLRQGSTERERTHEHGRERRLAQLEQGLGTHTTTPWVADRVG